MSTTRVGTPRRSPKLHGPLAPSRGASVVVFLVLLSVLVPVLYLFAVSLMDRAEVTSGILFTTDPKWSNWVAALTESNLITGISNSFIAAFAGAALTLVFALPGAWAIVRYRTGGATLGGTIMSPWLLPPIVAIVPIFVLLRTLGLNNTLVGLALVYALVNIPVAVWLLEGFLRKLPVEIDEAAQLDGAGSFRMLVSIVTPLVAPGLVAVGIIVAILNYNEFVLASFLTQSPDAQTLPVVISLFLGERLTHLGKIAAASVIGVIPVFVAAVFLQRWLIGGLTSGSVK